MTLFIPWLSESTVYLRNISSFISGIPVWTKPTFTKLTYCSKPLPFSYNCRHRRTNEYRRKSRCLFHYITSLLPMFLVCYYSLWLSKLHWKKENQISLISKEIQNGAVASSYMIKYLPVSSYTRKPFLIQYITLRLLHSEFPYIWGKLDFFLSVYRPFDCHSCWRGWSSPSWPSCRGRSGWGWGRRRDSTPCVQSTPSCSQGTQLYNFTQNNRTWECLDLQNRHGLPASWIDLDC